MNDKMIYILVISKLNVQAHLFSKIRFVYMNTY